MTFFPALRLSNLQRITRSAVEKRASPENPRYSIFDADLWDALGVSKSKAGVAVTDKTALQLTAVLACARVLGESVGSLSLGVFKRRKSGGKDLAPDHPNHTLLHDRWNPEMTSLAGREVGMAHLALRGNAYCEKELNGAGRPIALWPITPDRVTVERVRGVKTFKIITAGVPKSYTADTIMHVPGLGYDGLIGYNPIELAREALGVALAAQDHGAQYFGNNAEPSGVLTHPGKLSPEAQAKLKKSWETAHGGDNRRGTAVLAEGMKFDAIGISNKDSQFLETRQFSVTEIARIFRVPPHMIGDLSRATFSNIEQQSIDFVVHTLRPWLVRWEQVLNWELFGDRSDYFCEFNVDSLLRGDSAARGEFYTQLFNIGGLSVNEIREKENLNPVEGGDERFVQLNMTTLAKAGQQPAEEPKEPTGPPAKDPNDEAQRAVSAITPMVRDVLERAEFREQQAAKRAAKKGRVAFLAWVAETEDEQIEYLARALMPVVTGASALVRVGSGDGIAQRIAAAEVATHSRAYRAMAEPSEDVIATMFENTGTTLDHTATSLAAQIIGALTLTDTRKAA